MQTISKNLTDEILRYWKLKKEAKQCNNMFYSNDVSVGNRFEVNLYPFANRSIVEYSKKYEFSGCGVVLMFKDKKIPDRYTGVLKIYVDASGENIVLGVCNGYILSRNLSKMDILKCVKRSLGINNLEICEFYKKIKYLNVDLV